MEYVKIIPGDGEYLAIARSLLAIVGPDRAYEVESITMPGRGFRVPADVLIEHVRRLNVAAEPTPPAAPEPPVTPEPEPVIPAPTPAKRTPRRRGQTP